MVRAVWRGGHRGLLSCGESARWWQGNGRSEEENTPKPPPFSPWKNIEDINLIGLSRRGERTSLLIGCGGAQNKRGDMFSLAGPRCAFSRCHVIENVFYYCKTSHALQLHIVSRTKGWWNIKDAEHGANPSRRHLQGPLSLLVFRQLLSRDSGVRTWKETKFQLQVHPRRNTARRDLFQGAS